MPSKYAAIIDAGSTSSRLFLYKWEEVLPVGNGARYQNPVKIESLFAAGKEPETARSNGGIDNARHGTVLLMKEYLKPLFEKGAERLAERNINDARAVPVYVMATAGVRGAGNREDQEVIMRRAWNAIHALRPESVTVGETEIPFSVFGDGGVGAGNDDPLEAIKNIHSFVVPEKHEGVYAWIALNHGRHQPYQMPGILELGGKSMQIAFADPTALAGSFDEVCLFKAKHKVTSLSWVLGAEESRKNAVELKLIGIGEAFNPCLPHHESVRVNGHNFVGSGDFPKCLAMAQYYLDNFNFQAEGVLPLPALDIEPFTKRFYGVSTFWYTYLFFSQGGFYDKHDPYDPKLFRRAVDEYCNGSWLQPFGWNEDGVRDGKFIHNHCFAAAWMISLFHGRKGFNLRLSDHETWKGLVRFPSTPDLASRSSWTIGAATMIARHGSPKTFCSLGEAYPAAFVPSAYNGTATPSIPSSSPILSSSTVSNTPVSVLPPALSVPVEPSQPFYIPNAPSIISPSVFIGTVKPVPMFMGGAAFGVLLVALIVIGYQRIFSRRVVPPAAVSDEKYPVDVGAQPIMVRVHHTLFDKVNGAIAFAGRENTSIA